MRVACCGTIVLAIDIFTSQDLKPPLNTFVASTHPKTNENCVMHKKICQFSSETEKLVHLVRPQYTPMKLITMYRCNLSLARFSFIYSFFCVCSNLCKTKEILSTGSLN